MTGQPARSAITAVSPGARWALLALTSQILPQTEAGRLGAAPAFSGILIVLALLAIGVIRLGPGPGPPVPVRDDLRVIELAGLTKVFPDPREPAREVRAADAERGLDLN